jgi:hypothetical protein
MTSDGHIDDRAGGLASLPASDPERQAAYLHARSCVRCAAALKQGEAMFESLGEIASGPEPPQGILQGTAGRIESELSNPPVPWRSLSAVLVVLWLALVSLAKRRAGDGASWWEALGVIVIAVIALGTAQRLRGRSGLLAIGASGLLVALAWAQGPLAPLLGIECFLTEVATAGLSIAAVLWAFARGGWTRARAPLATIAAVGAIVGQAALHLTCPERTAGPHLFVFHFMAVVVAALAGASIVRYLDRATRVTN